MRHLRFLRERTEPLETSVFVCLFVCFWFYFLLSVFNIGSKRWFVCLELNSFDDRYNQHMASHILVVRRLNLVFAEDHLKLLNLHMSYGICH